MLNPEIARQLSQIVGERYVLTSPEDLICYGYDASSLQKLAGIVVLPRTPQEISEILKLANRERVPVVPRGAATGLSGGSLPDVSSIALSVTRMNQIKEIDLMNLVAVVEPGVVTADLQAEVEGKGLFYPPDPASLKQSTLGGNVAEGAGGPRCLKYGTTKDYVLGLEVVLPTGEIMRIGGKLMKDVTGYNLTQLFVGSEGTLGIITEIILRLVPKPPPSEPPWPSSPAWTTPRRRWPTFWARGSCRPPSRLWTPPPSGWWSSTSIWGCRLRQAPS